MIYVPNGRQRQYKQHFRWDLCITISNRYMIHTGHHPNVTTCQEITFNTASIRSTNGLQMIEKIKECWDNNIIHPFVIYNEEIKSNFIEWVTMHAVDASVDMDASYIHCIYISISNIGKSHVITIIIMTRLFLNSLMWYSRTRWFHFHGSPCVRTHLHEGANNPCRMQQIMRIN